MAAEEIFFGEAGNGAGGMIGSDLDRATTLATDLVASSGLGSSLAFMGESGTLGRLVASNEALRNEVNSVLMEAKSRARTVITANRTVIKSLAHRLAEANHLDGDVFYDALGK